jgi:Protein of unknown function (DUF2975)
MVASSASRLARIQRASRQLRGLCIILGVLTLAGMLNSMIHPVPPDSRTLAGIVFHGASLTDRIRHLWLLQTALYAAVNLKILYHLIRLLGLFAAGKIFEAANVAQVRQLGLTFMYGTVAWIIVLISAAPEIAAAQDQWVKIMPASPIGSFITGGVLLFASWVINEGRELRDEQNLVV